MIGFLEEKILEFKNFVEKSLKQKQGKKSSFRISVNFLDFEFDTSGKFSKKTSMLSQIILLISPLMDFNMETKILSADIASKEFQKEFIELCTMGKLRDKIMSTAIIKYVAVPLIISIIGSFLVVTVIVSPDDDEKIENEIEKIKIKLNLIKTSFS